MKTIKNKSLKNKTKKNYVYTNEDYSSGDGMITKIWGPSAWHLLHTISFNYPIEPTPEDKHNYYNFIINLQNVLPCKYCRMNLTKNFNKLPLTMDKMKNRHTFSKYIYELHEYINKMLGKKSGLSYEDVREMYEHFRSRCSIENKKEEKIIIQTKNKEHGCTEPLYGKKAKCVIKIVPHNDKTPTFTPLKI